MEKDFLAKHFISLYVLYKLLFCPFFSFSLFTSRSLSLSLSLLPSFSILSFSSRVHGGSLQCLNVRWGKSRQKRQQCCSLQLEMVDDIANINTLIHWHYLRFIPMFSESVVIMGYFIVFAPVPSITWMVLVPFHSQLGFKNCKAVRKVKMNGGNIGISCNTALIINGKSLETNAVKVLRNFARLALRLRCCANE